MKSRHVLLNVILTITIIKTTPTTKIFVTSCSQKFDHKLLNNNQIADGGLLLLTDIKST